MQELAELSAETRDIALSRFRLLEQGEQLERMAQSDGNASGVVKVVIWLKENFDKPFSIKLIAHEANMSPSGLHHHFKTLTQHDPPSISKAPSFAGGSAAHVDQRDGCVCCGVSRWICQSLTV
jgi:AraC-like DNA-binding protein